MIVLMVLAGLADGLSFLLLPRGGEANPLVLMMMALSPIVALAAKAGLIVGLVAARDYLRSYRDPVYGFATAAWTFGAITNVLSWR